MLTNFTLICQQILHRAKRNSSHTISVSIRYQINASQSNERFHNPDNDREPLLQRQPEIVEISLIKYFDSPYPHLLYFGEK